MISRIARYLIGRGSGYLLTYIDMFPADNSYRLWCMAEVNEGRTLDYTSRKSARVRLRPIVLTTLTTVAGLVPTACGLIGGIDSCISPMVMAMTWGLLVGTTEITGNAPLTT